MLSLSARSRNPIYYIYREILSADIDMAAAAAALHSFSEGWIKRGMEDA